MSTGVGQDISAVIETDLLPMIRRVAAIDPAAVVRLRTTDRTQSAFARLPSTALVARSVVGTRATGSAIGTDMSLRAQDIMQWARYGTPAARVDAAWRWALPPQSGWRALDHVPADVVMGLVGEGAQAHAALWQGGGSAREAALLLDQVVLTVRAEHQDDSDQANIANITAASARITNRVLSGMTSMGFLPPAGSMSVAVAGRWLRCAAQFGSVFAQDSASGLVLL